LGNKNIKVEIVFDRLDILLDTDVSYHTDMSEDSSSSEEEEGDEYDDDPYAEDTIEATEETVF